jgi:hypothetical protein
MTTNRLKMGVKPSAETSCISNTPQTMDNVRTCFEVEEGGRGNNNDLSRWYRTPRVTTIDDLNARRRSATAHAISSARLSRKLELFSYQMERLWSHSVDSQIGYRTVSWIGQQAHTCEGLENQSGTPEARDSGWLRSAFQEADYKPDMPGRTLTLWRRKKGEKVWEGGSSVTHYI